MELSAKQAIDWVGLQVRIGLVLLIISLEYISESAESDHRVNRKMRTVTVSVSHSAVTALTDERPEWG